MHVKSKSGRVFDLPDEQQTARIRSGIAEDPVARELSDLELAELRPVARPKAAETKETVSIRLSREVLAYFRGTGSEWQTRIDDVLREYVDRGK
jgi:uncharacterized protein (DUF4415 family)